MSPGGGTLEGVSVTDTETEEDSSDVEDEEEEENEEEATISAQDVTASGTCGEDTYYALDNNGTLYIYGAGAIEDSENASAPWYGVRFSILSVVIENGITSIGNYAFQYCTSLTSITIPDGVTDIGLEAFYGCTNLTSIAIPDSVVSIGRYAFYGCTNLTNISFSDNITSIGEYAFCQCTSLTSVTIPNSLTSINDYLFCQCTNLTSVILPNSITYIGFYAFFECSSLISISIPSSVTAIAGCAFDGCTSLISVTIPDSVTSIGSHAFQFCAELTSVVIPDSLTSIESYTFHYCTGLASITIPNNVTSIGMDAFSFCAGLTSITIPDSVMSIGNQAFLSCPGLTDVYYTGSEADWAAIDIGVYNSCLTDATIHYNSTGPEEDEDDDSAGSGEETASVLSINQVWGFGNNFSETMKFKYYWKFFGPAYATLLYEAGREDSGRCSGMVTSVISISGCNAPPVSSFIKNDGTSASYLHEITDMNCISKLDILYQVSAEEYIGYAQAYQFAPLILAEKLCNKNKLPELYEAISDSVESKGDYIEISIRGNYFGENTGHSLLAMGIGEDTETYTEILVYDCNRINAAQSLYLYKTNGTYTSWSYDPGYLSWGTGKDYASISYTTSGENFASDYFSDTTDFLALWQYNFLASVESNNVTLTTADGTERDLSADSEDVDVLRIDSYSVTEEETVDSTGSNNTLYWIKDSGELTFQNGTDENLIAVADGNNTISVKTPATSTLTTSVSDEEITENYAVLENLPSKSSYAIEFTSYDDSSESSLLIEGESSSHVTAQRTEDGIILTSDELQGIVIVADDSEDNQMVNISTDNNSVLIRTDESENLAVYEDTDGDGVYETDISSGNDEYETDISSEQTAPAATKITSAINRAKGIKLTWNAVDDATSYRVYRKIGSGRWKKVKTTTSTTWTDTAATKNGTKYQYKVYAVNSAGKSKASTTKTIYRLTAKHFTRAKNISGKKISLKWTRNTKATGYIIEYSTSKSFTSSTTKTVKIKGNKNLTTTLKNLKKGKTYYIRMRPYKTSGSVTSYAGWSKVKKVKVRK